MTGTDPAPAERCAASPGTLELGCDLLDKLLVDRKQRTCGRVDGILLELRAGRPPRVAAMETGLVTLMRRIHPAFGRWIRHLAARWAPVPMTPVRVALDRFRDIGVDVEVDVDAAADPKFLRFEKWLSRRVISRIPGGRP